MLYKTLITTFLLIAMAVAGWYFFGQEDSLHTSAEQKKHVEKAKVNKTRSKSGLLTALPGKPFAPTFELTDDNGDAYSLSDFRGKPIIINFWATWCPPCRAELPSMNRAWKKVKNEGIEMIAVNVGEDEDTVSAFKAEHPIDFRVLLDPSAEMVSDWPIKGLPTTFVIDKEGRLVYIATGEREWDSDEILNKVRELNK